MLTENFTAGKTTYGPFVSRTTPELTRRQGERGESYQDYLDNAARTANWQDLNPNVEETAERNLPGEDRWFWGCGISATKLKSCLNASNQ
jgi:hypothetical protein